jgi:hypothetical protein
LDTGHVEEQRPHFGDIDFTVLDHRFVGIGLNQFAHEDVVCLEVQHIVEFKLHVHRALADHGGGFQFSEENIEQGGLVRLLTGFDAAIVCLHHQVLGRQADAEAAVFFDAGIGVVDFSQPDGKILGCAVV